MTSVYADDGKAGRPRRLHDDYINLAGETFPEAAELLEERMFGQKLAQK